VPSALQDAPLLRIRIESEPANNLQKTPEIMVDKAQSVARERVGEVLGHMTEEQVLAVSRSLAVFLDVI
jgi:mRNA interferase MazF